MMNIEQIYFGKRKKKYGLRSEEERRGKEGKPQPTVHYI
jgi:hypothetical protein